MARDKDDKFEKFEKDRHEKEDRLEKDARAAKARSEPKPDQIVNLSEDLESAQKPYPQGNPPDPEAEFEKVHGFRRDGKK